MKYAELLNDAINDSGWSLAQIVRTCNKKHGTKITKEYLSRLRTGKKPPASDEYNLALADVLAPVSGITYEKLRVAAFKEVVPEDVLDALVAERLLQHEVTAEGCV